MYSYGPDGWMTSLHHVQKNLDIEIENAEKRKEAFSVLGQSKLAWDMHYLADNLRRQKKEIDEVINHIVERDIKRTREASENMLRATFAGIELGQRN